MYIGLFLVVVLWLAIGVAVVFLGRFMWQRSSDSFAYALAGLMLVIGGFLCFSAGIFFTREIIRLYGA